MYYIGIDLGGTNIAVGLVDENANILHSDSVPTIKERHWSEIIRDMAALSKKVVADAGHTMDEVAAVGIGCPGTIDKANGMVVYSNNIVMDHVPMAAEFRKHIDLPVYLENDANAAALGEYAVYGEGSDSFVFMTLGTGVGGGIILNGKVWSGFNGAGAEIGHQTLVFGGEPCTCGRRGCWETYSSATALHRQTKAAMEANPDSLMWKLVDGDITKVDGRIPFEAMKQGDAAGKAVVDRYCEYLACGLLNVINVFQPDVLCVGGGVCRQGEYLLGPVRKMIEEGRYSKYSAKQTQLCVAQLGNDAGIVGAACLGRN